ncbi:hypothetical protein Tco_1085350 [Tanacetum coccineum]
MYPPPHPSQPQISHSFVPPSQQYQSHQTSSVPQIAYNSPQPSIQPLTEFPQMDSGLVVHVFNQGDDQTTCLNKAIAFLTVVASSRFPSTNNQLKTFSNPRNQATVQDGRVTWLGNALIQRGLGMMHGLKKTEDLDAHDSDCNDVSTAKAVLMANLSNYGSDVISDVPHFEPYHTDMGNQSMHAMRGFEQTPVADFTNNEITHDSNIILYSQYLQETQQAVVQDINFYAQQDSMILSAIKQMSKQMINHVNNWEKANQERNNESLTTELERYKERVKIFEQRLNIDLSTHKKMIDSQMDDMIKENLALKQQIDSLE